jgi:shikimate dehydrogenase
MTETILAGLFGRGIGGSKARQMHEEEAAALGMPLVYRVIDFGILGIEDAALSKMIDLAKGMGFAGLNITHPYKQAVIPWLDALSPDAAALGAVNTIRFADGKSTGHNTDWSGFAASIREQVGAGVSGKIAQTGAGGAGSATAYALLKMGADQVALFDLDTAKSEALAERLRYHFPSRAITIAASPSEAIAHASGVVQTSAVGMASHPGLPFDPDLLCATQWLADIIYFPRETKLIEQAKVKGLNAFGGLSMAIHQAAGAFDIITDRKADADRMRARLEAETSKHFPESW